MVFYFFNVAPRISSKKKFMKFARNIKVRTAMSLLIAVVGITTGPFLVALNTHELYG